MEQKQEIIMSSVAVVLNQSNVSSGIVAKEQKLLNNPNLWHKVIVHSCGNLTRDIILKSILDSVTPADCIPARFETENGNASFFARNCKSAIQTLCNHNLIVPNPQSRENPFKLTIILAFTNTTELMINVQQNIAKVLTRKYNMATKSLNLDSFHKDPDLTEFCILSQPKILYCVLHLSKQFNIQSLKLTNNDIYMLRPIETIWGMRSLTSLDLRNNKIKDVSELSTLKTMQITDLYLDGNPLCDLYDEFTYVQAIKGVCPKIEKLDGVLLGHSGFMSFRRNFLCNQEGLELVDRFLEHFFDLYDSPNRSLLITLYHEQAMFSITCAYLVGQSTTSTSNLGIYKSMQRNIKVLSDLARSEEYLVNGPKKICDVFSKLPSTQHDPYNFTVDMVYYSETTAIITVTGVFRETTKSLSEAEQILGFTRTFILLKCSNHEYQIVNEQLHVNNATTGQQQRAFKIVRVNNPLSFEISQAKNLSEKKEMIIAFRKLTNLTLDWSKKCLDECDYDLKKSLVLFIDLYKMDKIPDIGFINK